MPGVDRATTPEADMGACKQVLVCVVLLSASMAGGATAQSPDQDRPPMPPVIEWPQEQAAQFSRINYALVFGGGEPQAAAAAPTQDLLNAIVPWLSANFALPPSYRHPSVKLVPAIEIVFMRYRALSAEKQREVLNAIYGGAGSPGNGRRPLAVYDDLTQTIFLPEGWTGRTQTELSVLMRWFTISRRRRV
jgi:hypothetical protein